MRVLLPLAFLLIVPAASTQQVADTTACTYERCSLQVERSLLGWRVLRGQAGDEIGASGLKAFFDAGARDFDLTEAVASSPGALAHAHRYEHRNQVASYVSRGASVSMLAVLAAVVMGPKYERIGQVGMVGVLGFTVVSIPLHRRARRSFSEAIEAYNASLPREQ